MDTAARENARLVAESIARLAAAHGGPGRMRARRDAPLSRDETAWHALAKAGWLGLLVPESSGGAGLGLSELAVFMEEVGRELMLEPIASAIVAARMLWRHGEPARERLHELVTGERIWLPIWLGGTHWPEDDKSALVVTETSTGIVLSGTIARISDGHWADGFLLDLNGSDGALAGLLRRNAPGLTLTAVETVDGGAICDLVCENVLVSSQDLFGSEYPAGAASAEGYRGVRIGAAAELVGLMGKALSMTTDYLKLRQQFKKPIGSFQAMQQLAASAYVDIQVTQALVRQACLADNDDRGQAAAAAAKARASDAGLRVTKAAIQCHGAIGFADEHDIGLYLRRAIVLSGKFGNARAQRRAYLDANGAELGITG